MYLSLDTLSYGITNSKIRQYQHEIVDFSKIKYLKFLMIESFD